MLFSVLPAFLFLTLAHAAAPSGSLNDIRHARAHSYSDDYAFSPEDGWTTLTASDEPYKYPNETQAMPHAEAVPDESSKDPASGGLLSRGLEKITTKLKSITKGLHGMGQPEDVVVTWYTGHDLQNPSCWPNSDWAPTDESYACALTLDGWKDKPACFRFLELCNTPKKCVFVRVVDTCAGCAKGSKHVDLTRAAFGELADYDEGIVKVKMRMASEPETWSEKLWGPQVGGGKAKSAKKSKEASKGKKGKKGKKY
ncbi:hypothetical protein PENSPDRAFT_633349 [Peniophora sp. CONT]|nr:hypothetical protein PENSPDRAFT_633349 [Peniophora sp. CONT]